MRFPAPAVFLFASLALATSVVAQKPTDVSPDQVDHLIKGANAEKDAQTSVQSQLDAQDAKIKKFHDCESAFLSAQNLTSSQGLSLAMKIAMRAKCGATGDDDMLKDRQKIMSGPQDAGAKAAGMKTPDYLSLKQKAQGYLAGDRASFTTSGITNLDARKDDLSSALGMPAVQPGATQAGSSMGGAGMGGMGAAGMSGQWSQAYTWQYINQLFAMQYSSGAAMFEKAYQPGEWTKWSVTTSDNKDNSELLERAFLGKDSTGNEWWRFKTIMIQKSQTDTIVFEALFKPIGDQVRQVVRMRAKLPGSKDPQELLVPQGMGMVNQHGMMQFMPTPESVNGATVGTESVAVGAGSFNAKHVRFGGAGNGGGSLDWWLTDDVPGGWIKFTGGSGKSVYTEQMTDKGTGAKSELGITM